MIDKDLVIKNMRQEAKADSREIERLQNKLDNLADELDKFLASKGSAMSTRAIAKAWINGKYGT